MLTRLMVIRNISNHCFTYETNVICQLYLNFKNHWIKDIVFYLYSKLPQTLAYNNYLFIISQFL